MLILSRKENQELVFPALGIHVRVLRTRNNGVKLGVVAPRTVGVRRGEVQGLPAMVEAVTAMSDQIESHELRNRLNSVVLKLELLRKLESAGLHESELDLVEDLSRSLKALDADFCRLGVPPSPKAPDANGARVLLVDDDLNERELLAAYLQLHGFLVTAVGDGVDALDRLNDSETLPHAVLLDMEMPRLDGRRTLRCIRADDRLNRLKVIGVSGHRADETDLPDGLRGFDAWFSKPIRLDDLLDLILKSSGTL